MASRTAARGHPVDEQQLSTSLNSLSVNGSSSAARCATPPCAAGDDASTVIHVGVPDNARGLCAALHAVRAVAELAALFESRVGQIAALIIEPLVQCAAGMAMHDPAYLREVRALCDRNGAFASYALDQMAGSTGTTAHAPRHGPHKRREPCAPRRQHALKNRAR